MKVRSEPKTAKQQHTAQAHALTCRGLWNKILQCVSLILRRAWLWAVETASQLATLHGATTTGAWFIGKTTRNAHHSAPKGDLSDESGGNTSSLSAAVSAEADFAPLHITNKTLRCRYRPFSPPHTPHSVPPLNQRKDLAFNIQYEVASGVVSQRTRQNFSHQLAGHVRGAVCAPVQGIHHTHACQRHENANYNTKMGNIPPKCHRKCPKTGKEQTKADLATKSVPALSLHFRPESSR